MKRITIILALALAAPSLAAERTTITYKGLSVRDPAPYGAAGLAWQNNFKALADRVGPCNYVAVVAPTAGDDTADGYAVGSLWYDTVTKTLYWCSDATAGAAKWLSIGMVEMSLGSMSTQAADNVAITGGSINGTAIGGTAASTIKATTLETSGEVGVGTAPAAGWPLRLKQSVHSQGLRLDYGAVYGQWFIDSGNNTQIMNSSGSLSLTSLGAAYVTAYGGIVQFTTAADAAMNLIAGGLFQFRDIDASSAVRLTIDSSTGELAIPSDTVGLKLDAGGTTTLASNGTVATLSKPLKAAGYQSSDGSAGLSQTIAIEDKSSVTHTMVFKNGLLTSYSTSP